MRRSAMIFRGLETASAKNSDGVERGRGGTEGRGVRTARLVITLISVVVVAIAASAAFGDSIGPITFEPPAYTVGNINGQQGWMMTGPYDVAVASVSSFPAASGYGFETQALRMSNAVVSGGFGDQTFSPGLASPAGEATTKNHFEASFQIGTTQASFQPGLYMSVSPDDGNGSRMSYLRFEDHADGVHVFFDDVTDPGPLGTVANFSDTDIATLDRAHSHTIRFSIDFVPGPANDVVKIYIDGVLKATGTTWEDYYRYDPEQLGNGNKVPTTSKLLFREGGTQGTDNAPATLGQGFLVDGVSLASSTLVGPPTNKDQCKNDGWSAFNNPSFKNQGDCEKFVKDNGDQDGKGGKGDKGDKGGKDK
jgi:hypothetical protein